MKGLIIYLDKKTFPLTKINDFKHNYSKMEVHIYKNNNNKPH